MWSPLDAPRAIGRGRAFAVCALLWGCTDRSPRFDGGDERVLALMVDASECLGAALRPSSAPPAEGVWSDQRAGQVRHVAALIGPAEIRAGATRVSRTIETIEGAAGDTGVRTRTDTAVVQLDLLPPYRDGEVGTADAQFELAPKPIAVYALSATVLVAAYDGCSARQPPAIRYVRRDTRGRIVTDAMLRRQPTTN